MKRYRQKIEELLAQLSAMDTTWRDRHADDVLSRLKQIQRKDSFSRSDLIDLISPQKLPPGISPKDHFDAGMTVLRLFMDLSKDEFTATLKRHLGTPIGLSRARSDIEGFYSALEVIGVLQRMAEIVNTDFSWVDLLTERLKSGRGSAIKGQRRGRLLEDFVESFVVKVFGKNGFEVRCQFVGANGLSKEKTDFAIPSKADPRILIEVKAYGATGSKQTDVIGDVMRIINEKRSDTDLLLVTDGMTWRERVNDLRKLVDLQNRGQIARIYTQSMADRFEDDLRLLRRDHGL